MIEVWSEVGPTCANDHMPQEMLTRLRKHISRHPWWQARARLIARLIHDLLGPGPKSVIDVGCGWGVTLDYLEKQKHVVTGLDIGRNALEEIDQPSRNLILGNIENGPIPKSAQAAFDVVLALDVLEHLDDDRVALAHLLQLARPGGLVLVTVPAGMSLWSEFDDVQGHRKRYERAELENLFAENLELTQSKVAYCWPWLVWPAKLTRKQQKVADISPLKVRVNIYERYVRAPRWPMNWLMNLIFAMSEKAILRQTNRSGTTLLGYGFRGATTTPQQRI